LGTTAPLESVTVPLMPPRKVWAKLGMASARKTKRLRSLACVLYMQDHLEKIEQWCNTVGKTVEWIG
jgi:hypothetical protein